MEKIIRSNVWRGVAAVSQIVSALRLPVSEDVLNRADRLEEWSHPSEDVPNTYKLFFGRQLLTEVSEPF